jgi:5-formyltetrahydrofolate cyclo-ligase
MLERSERRTAQRAIVRNLQRMRAYQRARAIAIYFCIDGEVDLSPVIEHARSSGKAIFVPVLAQNGLRFIELGDRAVYRRNRFGIPEPGSGRRIDPRELDVVLAPLVAFDARGHRLGMGKGYYDRSFGFLRLRTRWRKPKLIGIGFGFQKIDRLVPQHWDVPLWGAVTNTGVHYFEDTTTDELLATEI